MTPNKTKSHKARKEKYELRCTSPQAPSGAETQTDCVHKKTVLKLSFFLFAKHNLEEATQLLTETPIF